jgi:hypothetical protein
VKGRDAAGLAGIAEILVIVTVTAVVNRFRGGFNAPRRCVGEGFVHAREFFGCQHRTQIDL